MIKRAFTLAEVLITLTIIGVVAAITIPSVIANAHQQEFKTGLKKAVAALDQAVQLNIAIENETPYENGNIFYYLQRHMAVVKNSANGYHYGVSNFSRYKHSMKNMAFYTKDGMRFEVPSGYYCTGLRFHESNWCVYTHNYRCGSWGMNLETDKGKDWSAGDADPCIVMVDVNGDRKPHPNSNAANNPWSENYPSPWGTTYTDTFLILITNDGAVPFGTLAQKVMYDAQQ